MRFDPPLVPARLVRRYKRFLADVVFEDGGRATVHCPNPGAMTGCAEEGARIWLSPIESATAKLFWRWELVEVDGAPVLVNTGRANRIVEEAIAAARIPELAGYRSVRREVRYGRGSRIDLLLEDPGRCYVEVKSVTLRRGPEAQFPDAVTARGRKHLEELAVMAGEGFRAVMVYLVQYGNCARFALAEDIDPAYAETFVRARQAGVEAIACACSATPGEVRLVRGLSIRPPGLYLD